MPRLEAAFLQDFIKDPSFKARNKEERNSLNQILSSLGFSISLGVDIKNRAGSKRPFLPLLDFNRQFHFDIDDVLHNFLPPLACGGQRIY